MAAADEYKKVSDKPPTKSGPPDKSKAKVVEAVVDEVCQVVVPLRRFYTGALRITGRQLFPVEPIGDCFVSVSLSEPLLSKMQRCKLNPLVIEIHSATAMPDSPVAFADLAQKCQPAYVQYSLLGLPLHRSEGLTQSASLHWADINVILTESMDRCLLKEHFASRPFQVQVHDRDPIVQQFQDISSLFGQELDDILDTSQTDQALQFKAWHPYGIAHFDLSELLLGHTMLQLRSPIHNCPTPQDYVTPYLSDDGRLVSAPSTTHGPVLIPLRAGNYLEYEASLKITVRLACPLTTPIQMVPDIDTLPSAKQCPFGRLVFKFASHNLEFLSTLTSLVSTLSARALDLDRLPSHIFRTAMATYKLTGVQRCDTDLDIVTGFHLSDSEMHLVVLEGLQNGALKKIADELSKTLTTDVTMLYHSRLNFHRRLYAQFDVDLYSIRLHESLTRTLSSPLIYLRELAPCVVTLTQLQALSRSTRLRDAVRNAVFPAAEALVCVGREFGVPMNEHDFKVIPDDSLVEHCVNPELEHSTHNFEEKTNILSSSDHLGCVCNSLETESFSSRKTYNSAEHQTNWICQNKIDLTSKSEINRIRRNHTVPVFIEAPTTQLAFEKLRSLIMKHDPHHLYTFSPEFHHSGTLPRGTMKEMAKEDEKRSRKLWKTSDGWQNRGKLTWKDWNRHDSAVDDSKIAELMIPLDELYKADSAATRKPFPWSLRKRDLDTWTQPRDTRAVSMLHDNTTNGLQPIKSSEENRPVKQVHAKKSPQCRSYLRRYPVNIPELSVVHCPSLDPCWPGPTGDEQGHCCKGLTAGPIACRRLTASGNQIPIADYERQMFSTQRGQDFNVYYKERSKLWAPKIAPLSKCELTEYRSTKRCGPRCSNVDDYLSKTCTEMPHM